MFKKTKFYFGGQEQQYRAPEVGFPSCEIQKDNLRDSQREQSRTVNEESFEANAQKQKQYCVAVAVAIAVS